MSVPNTRPTITATWFRQEAPILKMVLFADDSQECARYLVGRAHCLTQDYSRVLEEESLVAHHLISGGFQIGDFVASIGYDSKVERIESLLEVMSDTFYSSLDDRTPGIGAGRRFFGFEEVGGEYWRYLKAGGE